jgi:hypothetical protein
VEALLGTILDDTETAYALAVFIEGLRAGPGYEEPVINYQ